MSIANILISVALAEWLRRVPAKYMGFPRESSNLSGDVLPICFACSFIFEGSRDHNGCWLPVAFCLQSASFLASRTLGDAHVIIVDAILVHVRRKNYKVKKNKE
ncbi:hypothetical protein MTR_5g032400 [Medicago truncatula]|uniref:Transmembrane protein n=1 Tax=Medicago truncatula TaxID=3880 RepID=G7JXP9_MEDTR|nr:hypothetical protein MTR_5g032400 [Medicago truncatula]